MDTSLAYNIAREAAAVADGILRATPSLLYGTHDARSAVLVRVWDEESWDVEILRPHEIEMECDTLARKQEFAASLTEIGLSEIDLAHVPDDVGYMLVDEHGIDDERVTAGIREHGAFEYAVHCVGRVEAQRLEHLAIQCAAEAYIISGQLDRDIDRLVSDIEAAIMQRFGADASAVAA